MLSVFIVVLIYSALFYWAQARFSASFLAIGALVLTPLILFLDVLQFHLQARLLFVFSCVLFVFGASVGVKEPIDLDYYYFPISILSLLLLNHGRYKSFIFALLLPVVGWALHRLAGVTFLAVVLEGSTLSSVFFRDLNFIGAFGGTGYCLFRYIQDIQALQKETKIELNKSLLIQKKLDDAQRVARIGNWEFDLKTQELFWSKEQFRIFEIDSSSVDNLYQIYRNKIHPEDLKKLDDKIENCIRTGYPYTLEHRIVLNSGEIRYLNCRGEAIKNAKNEVVGLMGIGQDISEHVRAEQLLSLHKIRYASIAANNASGELARLLFEELEAMGHQIKERGAEPRLVAQKLEELLSRWRRISLARDSSSGEDFSATLHDLIEFYSNYMSARGVLLQKEVQIMEASFEKMAGFIHALVLLLNNSLNDLMKCEIKSIQLKIEQKNKSLFLELKDHRSSEDLAELNRILIQNEYYEARNFTDSLFLAKEIVESLGGRFKLNGPSSDQYYFELEFPIT